MVNMSRKGRGKPRYERRGEPDEGDDEYEDEEEEEEGAEDEEAEEDEYKDEEEEGEDEEEEEEDEEADENEYQDEEEVEVVEEEESPRARRAGKGVRRGAPRGGINKKAAAIGAVVIIVAVSLLAFFIYSKTPQAPKADIAITGVDENDIQAGTPVTFDGTGSSSKQVQGGGKIKEYAWDFGDDQTGTGAVVIHTFLKSGDYTVSLKVTDANGLSNTASITITVSGMAVTIPLAKIGDTISYSMDFTIDISNSQGLWTYTEEPSTPFTPSLTATVTSVHIEDDAGRNPDNTITTSKGEAEDGFAQTHQCLDRTTTQTMPFKGTAVVKLQGKSGAATTVNEELSGDMSGVGHVCTDLTTNRTVKTQRTDDYSIQLVNGGKTTQERTGSDVSKSYVKNRGEIDINGLRENRTFRTGDKGEYATNGLNLLWDVVGEDSVSNKPTLKVHMTIDDATMRKNSFTTFDLNFWLSSEFSAPLKLAASVAGDQDGNTYSIAYTTTFKEFKTGSTDVPYGSCTASTLDGHTYKARPGVEYLAPDDYAPATGSGTTSLDNYPLPDAVDYAKANSPGLSAYLGSKPDAFLRDAYYNESSGYPTWNLTFGTKTSDSAYNIIVTQNSIKSQGNVKVKVISKSVKDISPVLTFSGAEDVMKGYSDIQGEVYKSGKIDLSTYSFGARADVPYETASAVTSLSLDKDFSASNTTEYYFYVRAPDGSYSAAIDAGTGQLLFVKTHSGN